MHATEAVSLQYPHAVHIAKVVIEQQHIKYFSRQQLKRLDAAGAGNYLVMIDLQQFLQKHQVGAIVFCNQALAVSQSERNSTPDARLRSRPVSGRRRTVRRRAVALQRAQCPPALGSDPVLGFKGSG